MEHQLFAGIALIGARSRPIAARNEVMHTHMHEAANRENTRILSIAIVVIFSTPLDIESDALRASSAGIPTPLSSAWGQ